MGHREPPPSGLPPARRGVPQIEVAFDVGANGIVHVNSKGSCHRQGESRQITGNTTFGRRHRPDGQGRRVARSRGPQAACVRELRNEADNPVFRTEKLLSENAHKINDRTETVTQSHANGSACPARGASPLSSASDSQTGHKRLVHLAGRPGKRR
jgi:molecular chaperone DnaK (HSP70)